MDIPESDIALVVDLDGSLLKTDSLWESFFGMLSRKPWLVVFVPIWLFRGKVTLKRKLAAFGKAHCGVWPYNENVLTEIENAKAANRTICLATAAHRNIALAVTKVTGVFDHVEATDSTQNLKGENKLARLVELYGERGFDYIGDSGADVCIWAHARQAIVVGRPNSAVVRRAEKVNENVRCLPAPKPGIRAYMKLLRAHQWSKNLLVLVPLILGHAFRYEQIVKSGLALLTFCCCASTIYIFNDLLDLPLDRRHSSKKKRPFAAGMIPLWQGPAFMLCTLFLTIAVSAHLPRAFQIIVLAYLFTTMLYSYLLKQMAMLDVVALACLYVIRIIGGAVVLDERPSSWLLGFAFFIFLGLALMKRTADLIMQNKRKSQETFGRAYNPGDKGIIENMASASGFCGVMILALYIDSLRAAELYSRSYLLWLLCPLIVYWFGRMLLITHRGDMHSDPVRFVMTDKVSILCGALGIFVLCLSL